MAVAACGWVQGGLLGREGTSLERWTGACPTAWDELALEWLGQTRGQEMCVTVQGGDEEGLNQAEGGEPREVI